MDTSWLARLRRAATWLDASPPELGALAILLVGAVAVGAFVVRGGTATVPLTPLAPADLAPSRNPGRVVVHVAGAVLRPGLVELSDDARVADAIHAAGGPAVDAQLDGLNLARLLADGEQLRIPRLGDVSSPTGAASDSMSPWSTDGRLDLNLATAADLQQLPGIGPVLAERILGWREQHGGFEDVGQLREVSGIGEKTFQALADLVAV